LETIKNLVPQKDKSIVLHCPNCDCKLSYNNEKLFINLEQVIKSIDYLYDKVNVKVEIIKLIKEYNKEKDEIAVEIQNIKSLLLKEKMLLQKGNELSPALKQLKKQIEKIEKDISEKTDVSKLESIQEELQQLKMDKKQREAYKMQQKSTSEKINQVKQQIKIEKEKISGKDIDYEKSIDELEQLIKKLKLKNEKDLCKKECVDNYLINLEKKKQIERWQQKIKTIKSVLEDLEKRYTGLLVLKDKYNQAEIIALQTTLNTINEHTKYYLETFFDQGQLIANLQADFSGKKIQTLKINTIINYKGNEYDNVSQLSGGEFDRCTLASICGINSLLNSPILILDESLSSLDSDTNTEILRFLSDLSMDKLILVCSHEAVRGIFDDVIELN